MVISEGICTKCRENFFNCKCSQFFPNEPFTLTKEEIIALKEYFYKRAGYISAEFDEVVLQVIKRLDNES